MPLLGLGKDRHTGSVEASPEPTGKSGVIGRTFFETCANSGCVAGWLRPLRSRSSPVFEEGWTCSLQCTRALIQAAINREQNGHEINRYLTSRPIRRHRIPLGLLMLQHGWITHKQLRAGLDAQKQAGTGRIGNWLVQQGAVSEETVARALALQWSCPVVPARGHNAEGLSTVMPRLFVDAFGALPVRVGGSKILYLGFEDALDPVLALAIARMTGLHVECGVVVESEFRSVHCRILAAAFPPATLIEAVSRTAAALVLAKEVEQTRPLASRLVRVHDYLWLRLWTRERKGAPTEGRTVRDLICSIGSI